MDTNKLFQYLGQSFAQMNVLSEENEKLRSEAERQKLEYDNLSKEYNKLQQQEQMLQGIIRKLQDEVKQYKFKPDEHDNGGEGTPSQ